MTNHIKLIKPLKVRGLTQYVTLPVGRCLEIVGSTKITWAVEVEEGEGHIVFNKDDTGITIATMDDMVNEPEYNDHESF